MTTTEGISRKLPVGVVAVVVSLSMLALGACGAPAPDTTGLVPPTTAAPPGPLAIAIGDSITQFSRDRLAFELVARGWNTSVLGRAGATIDDMRASLLGAATLKPKALVIELGSNDLGYASDPDRTDPDDWSDAVNDAIGRIGRTLDDVAAVPCIVWVNVTDWTNFFGYDTRRSGPRFNAALAAAATQDPRLHVVDYAGLFRPDTPERAAALEVDFDAQRLHPTTKVAVDAWVQAVGNTVDRSCRT